MKLIAVLLMLPVAGLLVAAAVFVAVCICACVPRTAREADCIIVLGAKLHPDGSMKETLRLRCDKAFEVWLQDTSRRIIVCGGQMPGEPRPHSEAMRDYLLEKGVPGAGLLVENISQYTVQNFENARKLLEEHGLRCAAVVTSDYHLTRALWIARSMGLNVWGVAAPSPSRFRARLKTRFRETISWFLYFFHGINRKGPK